MEPSIEYRPLTLFTGGKLKAMLEESFQGAPPAYVEYWRPHWDRIDRDIHDDPDACRLTGFFSVRGGETIGFVTWDKSCVPEAAPFGPACILPAFRGRGDGAAQTREAVRRLKGAGCRVAFVHTGAEAFFEPARRMLLSCGFEELQRTDHTGDTLGIVSVEYGLLLQGQGAASAPS
jgi:GNAT superfamily N-acetyltransferase